MNTNFAERIQPRQFDKYLSDMDCQQPLVSATAVSVQRTVLDPLSHTNISVRHYSTRNCVHAKMQLCTCISHVGTHIGVPMLHHEDLMNF